MVTNSASIPRREIIRRIDSDTDHLDITPRPDNKAISKGAIDLRVGNLFLSANLSSIPAVHAGDLREGAKLFQETRIRQDEHFVMQPRQFVLASTFEYISLPRTLCGLLQSRSTYGRMGLIAATAAYVGPGYKGCPTLELVNAGEVALKLAPYESICQLVLFSADEKQMEPSRYHGLTRPSFAREPMGPRPLEIDQERVSRARRQFRRELRSSGVPEADIRKMVES